MRATTYVLLLLAPLLAFAPAQGHGVLCEAPADWSIHHYHSPAPGYPFLSPSVDTCSGGDGHAETAAGGARLAAGPDSLACYGESAHHPPFGLITAMDDVWGYGVGVHVGVDLSPGCGDFLVDQVLVCPGACYPTFPPGSDGMYHVFVGGATAGHVVS